MSKKDTNSWVVPVAVFGAAIFGFVFIWNRQNLLEKDQRQRMAGMAQEIRDLRDTSIVNRNRIFYLEMENSTCTEQIQKLQREIEACKNQVQNCHQENG